MVVLIFCVPLGGGLWRDCECMGSDVFFWKRRGGVVWYDEQESEHCYDWDDGLISSAHVGCELVGGRGSS